MSDQYRIRMAEQEDCSAIMSIKNEAILSSTFVYDEETQDLSFYQQWLADAAERGYHLMVAVIDSENSGSRKLHEQIGFTYNGLIPACGQKFGQWLDIVYYSYTLGNDSELEA